VARVPRGREEGVCFTRAYPRDGEQPPCMLIGARLLRELVVEVGDPLVEPLPALLHIGDEIADTWTKCCGVAEQLTQSDLQLGAALRHDMATLEENASDLVHQRCALADQ